MNPPPRDATHASCGFCHQQVESAVLRPTIDGAVVLVTCPHCGAVWGAWPRVEQGETPHG